MLGAACAVEPRRAPIEPEGRIEILGPEIGFSTRVLPADWLIDGQSPPSERLNVVIKDSVPALRIVGGESEFVLARRTDTPLLVSPYLSWSRRVEPPAGAVHPVGLVVGFSGGDRTPPSRGAQRRGWFGPTLPPHDRQLSIGWGEASTERDLLDPADAGARNRRYVQRMGPEALDSWRLEAVDLVALYARAWPGDDTARVRIAFVGIAVTSERPGTAYLSGILLSR